MTEPPQSSESDEPRDPSEMTFEDAASELESIINRIESGDVGLEESLDQRRRGEALLKRCRSVLDVAEQEIDRLERDESPTESDGAE